MPIVLLPSATGQVGWALYGVDGIEHTLDLDLTGYGVLVGATGRFNAPRSIATQAVPLREGLRVVRANVGAQEMTIPVYISGATLAVLLDRVGWLSRWLETDEDHYAYLRYTRPDATRREVAVQYRGGLEGDESFRNAMLVDGGAYMTVVLDLLAPDPAWYDLTDTEPEPYAIGSVTATWPYSWPLVLTSSEVLAVASIDNGGDLPAYPVWTVTGPSSDLTLTNHTTGEVLRVAHALAAGQTLAIDTRPRYLRSSDWQVYDAAGANLYTAASGTLWTLPSGISTIQVTVAGATSASSVQLAYRRRWRGP